MIQISFSEAEFAAKKPVTKCALLIGDVEKLVPRRELLAVIDPHYPTKRGRPPIGPGRMLRVYLVEEWYSLPDGRAAKSTGKARRWRQALALQPADVSAVSNLRSLAAKSASQHKFRHVDAARTVMPRRTLPSTASRALLRLAGAHTLDPAPGTQFACWMCR